MRTLDAICLLLYWLGNLSAAAAIVCIGYYCARNVDALINSRDEEVLVANDSAWVGFVFIALWMACAIGRIGL